MGTTSLQIYSQAKPRGALRCEEKPGHGEKVAPRETIAQSQQVTSQGHVHLSAAAARAPPPSSSPRYLLSEGPGEQSTVPTGWKVKKPLLLP